MPGTRPKTNWCVFVSAGDFNNISSWLKDLDERPWDLIVVFYGDDDAIFQQLCQQADVVIAMRGGKFQNLKKLHMLEPGLLKRYSHIWVADDDLILNSKDIAKLFEVASAYDFWVCQPAFDPSGRISHTVTRPLSNNIRIVNFVEVGAPLFRSDKLFDFLDVYNGDLVGWGIDWWYCIFLESNIYFKFAVIDQITVVNPNDSQRPGGEREIEKLQSAEHQHRHWTIICKSRNLVEFEQRTLATIDPTPLDQRPPGPGAEIKVSFGEARP